jgi:hypothetical protein
VNARPDRPAIRGSIGLFSRDDRLWGTIVPAEKMR